MHLPYGLVHNVQGEKLYDDGWSYLIRIDVVGGSLLQYSGGEGRLYLQTFQRYV
jgi:hypothetical protein